MPSESRKEGMENKEKLREVLKIVDLVYTCNNEPVFLLKQSPPFVVFISSAIKKQTNSINNNIVQNFHWTKMVTSATHHVIRSKNKRSVNN